MANEKHEIRNPCDAEKTKLGEIDFKLEPILKEAMFLN